MKTAFIGYNNDFTRLIIDWLNKNTELKVCFYANELCWNTNIKGQRKRNIINHFKKRIKKYGILKVINEIGYFTIFRYLINANEHIKLEYLIDDYWTKNQKTPVKYKEVWINDIKSDSIINLIKEQKIDTVFSMCIDVFFPSKLINAPKNGVLLWHEGITPEYKGLYSPFWAMYNKDYKNLGYTLLKMNQKFDDGPIYAQGTVHGIDIKKDWHGYIGHKAILDSLPDVKKVIEKIDREDINTLNTQGRKAGYYSFPGITHLMFLIIRRLFIK